jgi:hypothetical protein
MVITLACMILCVGYTNRRETTAIEKINNIKWITEGTNKKLNGGTTGKSLSASHNFQDIIFAMIQKKQMILVAIIFFEVPDKLVAGIRINIY